MKVDETHSKCKKINWNQLESMTIIGNSLKSMKINKDQWNLLKRKSTKTHPNHCQSMNIHGNMYKNNENEYKSIGFYENL